MGFMLQRQSPNRQNTRPPVFILVSPSIISLWNLDLNGIETWPAKLNSKAMTISASSFSAHSDFLTHSWILKRGWVKTYDCTHHTWQRFSAVFSHHNSPTVSTSCLKRDKMLKMDLPRLSRDAAVENCIAAHTEEFPCFNPACASLQLHQRCFHCNSKLHTQDSAEDHGEDFTLKPCQEKYSAEWVCNAFVPKSADIPTAALLKN